MTQPTPLIALGRHDNTSPHPVYARCPAPGIARRGVQTPSASQRLSARGVAGGRRSRASGVAPDDLIDLSLPATGRKRRPARSRPGLLWRLLGQLTGQSCCSDSSTSPHPGPTLALGRSLSTGQAELPDCSSRLLFWAAAPGTPRFPSPGRAHHVTPRRRRHHPYAYIMNRNSLSPPPKAVVSALPPTPSFP